LTTSCPFCFGNLTDIYEEIKAEIKEKIITIDFIDFLLSKNGIPADKGFYTLLEMTCL